MPDDLRTTNLNTSPTQAQIKAGDYDAIQGMESLLYAGVCARVDVDPQAALDAALTSPGTSAGRWVYVERDDLPEAWWTSPATIDASPTDDGHDAAYPTPCEDHPDTHVHFVGTC